MKNNLRPYFSSFIFATAIIITALIVTNGYKNRNKAINAISVTGLGSKDFVSDLIVWSGSFIRKSTNLKDAYAQLDTDRETIKRYLNSKGIKADEMVFAAIEITKEYDEEYNNFGNRTKSTFTGYMLRQVIQIESNEVNKLEDISRQVSELINLGIEFYSDVPQYYYTKLAELKIEMIAEATNDANTRAKKIAENAGSKVGKLKKADLGVFQIVAQNSSDQFSWGGSFNTGSKRKTATITVKLEYAIN